MLRITKETDYGVMLLAFLSEQHGEIRTAREAAEWSRLPLPMVSKILRSLARGGVLEAHRGATGGYSLKRPAAETSVAEVIRVLEGPISLVQCGSEPGACDQEHTCKTRVNWAAINREIETTLERIPVTAMIGTGCGSLLSVTHEGSV